MKIQSLAKQVPKNLAINILSFMATVTIGLWLTPYLLNHLGIVAYGLIPLAMFFSQYVSVIINAINMSINRFLVIALQKNEDKDANEIFNTSLVIITIFIVFQALVMVFILYDIDYFFSIPTELVSDAVWLFALTFIGFSISLIRSVFSTSMFAYNRLDILRMIDIVQNVVRVVVIVALFIYDKPSLKYVGIANVLASISAILPTFYYFKQYTPRIKVQISSFSKQRVSELSQMSTWILINQVGVLLLGNIDLYLVNKWIGIQATGEYAIVLQFTIIFKMFIALLAGVLTPIIMIYYAKGEYSKLRQFTILSSKVMVVGLIVPLTILISFSSEVIFLWLGETYTYLSNIVSFSLLYFVIAIPVIPLFNVTMAYNKVKLPAIMAIVFGLFNILGMYILISQTDIELWAVVSIKLIFEITFSLFILIYVSRIINVVWYKIFKIYIFGVVSFLILYILIQGVQTFYAVQTLVELGILSVVIVIGTLPIMGFIFFTKEEKNVLVAKYPKLKRILL